MTLVHPDQSDKSPGSQSAKLQRSDSSTLAFERVYIYIHPPSRPASLQPTPNDPSNIQVMQLSVLPLHHNVYQDNKSPAAREAQGRIGMMREGDILSIKHLTIA